ncbi:MAG: hypothetical protein KIT18_04285 [Burkholderiales bacterium]|nr:hypothetical protein [Burkholderiales bacterium]
MSLLPASSDPRLTVAASEPLSAGTIESALDEQLDPVLSSRRTATHLARALAPLARHEQDFVLHWVAVIARTNPEMAYQFAAAAPAALARLSEDAAEAWIIEAMDTYDREGLHRGSRVFRQVDEFVDAAAAGASAVTFEDAARVLRFFACGLSGRRMKIDMASHPYTDTETLFLPPSIAISLDKNYNFLIYKVILVFLWAQSRFGTFHADLQAACTGYPDPVRALELLNHLETVRLEACIARTLPGLARDMARLCPYDEANGDRWAALREAGATVQDSIALLAALYPEPLPPRHVYATTLQPAYADAARRARLVREKQELRSLLGTMLEENNGGKSTENSQRSGRFSVSVDRCADDDASVRWQFALDGQPIVPSENAAQLLDSILQDLGEIPDEYLVPAGDGAPRKADPQAQDPANAWRGIHHEEISYFYNEWDCKRRHYRKNWCVLREFDVQPADAEFVETTLAKYAPQIARLKHTFELMRGEDRLVRRQRDGGDIDLDAAIAAWADMQCGMALPDGLFTRRHRAERDLAVMLMVDMSGSTKGWINDAEREALVMLCEALEVLGDRYAIYGFSGLTRKRCEIFRVKRFDEPYDDAVRSRVAGIRPQDYTRMGAAIRHLTTLLNRVEARTKLLITLSDGKPDDYSDHYRGEYGIEDTRQALIEAHRSGIRPFCVTIDREARDYLPRLYGPVNWTLVDDVARLPLKMADIYRRLTT